MQNSETHVPDPLDALLRDLHQIWCPDDCPPDWDRPGADPVSAARELATALWDMAEDGARGGTDPATALAVVNAYLART
jgi:hypothetical protein